MAPKTLIQVTLLLLSFLRCSCEPSWNSEKRTDYENWISWNLKNYRKATLLKTQWNVKAPDSKPGMAGNNTVKINVRQDDSGDFNTIRQALDSIPPRNIRRVIVSIGPGVYREKIVIPRNMEFITLIGDATKPPTITGNDTAAVIGRDGMPFGTFHSATVAVDANYFVAVNIKFENTASHEVGKAGEQAVAVRVSGTKVAFYNCSFYGDQDTLYDHRGLHYFNNCFIQGSVDFIFGSGRSLYENCYLNSIAKKAVSITAQKRTNASLESGFSFKSCVITGSGRAYLGRAWGDYSRVVFSYTFMDKIIVPQGWSDWGDQKRDSRVYYGEYRCSGPGANLTGRVAWAHILTDQEAQPFLGTHYIEGDTWLVPLPN
ncbi:probable pectinesterase 53 [Prosopis cineraria]|uniref:probable pectinesterase 53 n=1 Tax=Prosopis cineraria TaxID=364024 RepID=UPI0024101677|nr:probable pectinesterase 53 [Prosopis cineraria]